MSDGSKSFTTFGVYAGHDAQVACHHYSDRTPIIAIDAGGCSVTIAPEGREATDAALAFARALAATARDFAAEVERLHAARHHDDDAKAAESKAA